MVIYKKGFANTLRTEGDRLDGGFYFLKTQKTSKNVYKT